MSEVACFYLERVSSDPNDTRVKRTDTGEIFVRLGDAPPGAMWNADWMVRNEDGTPYRGGGFFMAGPHEQDGRFLVVRLPNGHDWCAIDVAADVRYLSFQCRGCDERHIVPVTGRRAWGFNDNLEQPTLTPSILVTGKRRITEAEYHRIIAGETLTIPDRVCHSFVTDGRIQYLSDCTHALAGQTIDLPEIDA